MRASWAVLVFPPTLLAGCAVNDSASQPGSLPPAATRQEERQTDTGSVNGGLARAYAGGLYELYRLFAQ